MDLTAIDNIDLHRTFKHSVIFPVPSATNVRKQSSKSESHGRTHLVVGK